MPCGGVGTVSATVTCSALFGAFPKQRKYVLKRQRHHMNRMSRFTREKIDLEMFTSAVKWVEETPTLRSSASTGSH